MRIVKSSKTPKGNQAKIIQFLSRKSNPNGPPQLRMDDLVVQRIKSIVEKHFTEFDLDVVKLCKLAAVSRTQLHRKLKASVNMSATEYIRSVRIIEAKFLLRNPRNSITAVAFDSGFQNPNYFSRVFVQVVGLTPSEYQSKVLS